MPYPVKNLPTSSNKALCTTLNIILESNVDFIQIQSLDLLDRAPD